MSTTMFVTRLILLRDSIQYFKIASKSQQNNIISIPSFLPSPTLWYKNSPKRPPWIKIRQIDHFAIRQNVHPVKNSPKCLIFMFRLNV